MSATTRRSGCLLAVAAYLSVACGPDSSGSQSGLRSGGGEGGASATKRATSSGVGSHNPGGDGHSTGGSGSVVSAGSSSGGSAAETGGAVGTTPPVGTSPQPLSCKPNRFPKDASCSTNNFVSETGGEINWAEALQKTLWFFNANRSGRGATCSDVQWRGPSHLEDEAIALDPDEPNGVNMSRDYINAHRDALDPDGNGKVDLSGGYYDAGDYVRFGLPSAYAATMIAWGMYEFPKAYSQTKMEPEALALLRNFADYFMRGTFFEKGEVIAFAHQVGDISDHSCGWMPPEVRLPSLCPRKGYFATHERPASDVVAAAAAALTLIGEVHRRAGSDVTFADKCLDHAKALYRFAKLYPDTKADTSDNLYESLDEFDKLAWAALWLHIATGDDAYLNDLVGDIDALDDLSAWSRGYMSKFPGFTEPTFRTFANKPYTWSSAHAAVFTKAAEVISPRATGLPSTAPLTWFAENLRVAVLSTLSSWVDATVEDGGRSPGGFSSAHSGGWGCGRYNASSQFLSLVYAKTFPEDPRVQDLKAWARSQSEYLLGRNPLEKSYLSGFTGKFANQPHHAAAHASPVGTPEDPVSSRHILWGGFVNGPANPSTDEHIDRRSDFTSNEVTIDSNAAFLSALAANYVTTGSATCPIAEFPPTEPEVDEFYVELVAPTTANCVSQTELTLVNYSVHPPRYDEHLSTRFYIDVSELKSAGVSPNTITLRKLRDLAGEAEAETKVSGPFPCPANPNLSYIEFDYEGAKFWGANPALSSPRTVTIEYGTGTQAGCIWDPTNDYSTMTLTGSSPQKHPRVTVYSQGTLIYGEEPPCHDK